MMQIADIQAFANCRGPGGAASASSWTGPLVNVMGLPISQAVQPGELGAEGQGQGQEATGIRACKVVNDNFPTGKEPKKMLELPRRDSCRCP